MGYKAKKYEVNSATLNVGFNSHEFDGNFIVHLKEGSGESVTITAVSQVYLDADGVETVVSLSTPAETITAGKTLRYAKYCSPIIKITLSGAPVDADTVIEVIARH